MKKKEKLDELNSLIPNAFPQGCKVVVDMISGKRFALVDKEYNNLTGRHFSFGNMKSYLLGMQDMVRYININKIKF